MKSGKSDRYVFWPQVFLSSQFLKIPNLPQCVVRWVWRIKDLDFLKFGSLLLFALWTDSIIGLWVYWLSVVLRVLEILLSILPVDLVADEGAGTVKHEPQSLSYLN